MRPFLLFLKKHNRAITAFFLPVIILALLLATQGIWWGSETTILASDGFHQYVIFHQTLRNILHGEGSLFYSFTSGLGINFYALISYYLGSFLSPISYFFTLDNMPDALYLFVLLKVGLMGWSASFSLTRIYRRLHSKAILALSTSYALMSFTISQVEINTWLDPFILYPLILLGIHRLFLDRKLTLYYISLTLLFLQSYYFGFMMAIFLLGWATIQWSYDFKKRAGAMGHFAIVSLLAALSSCVMLLPVYLDLKTHGETLSQIVWKQTEHSWALDVFAKQMVGAYDTTKFGAIPTMYVGLLPFLLAALFFTLSAVKWPVKLTTAAFVGFILASFYLQPLDLLWQGLHAPNMFLHRYAWVLSLLIIYLAAACLQEIHSLTPLRTGSVVVLLSAGFLATFFYRKHYAFLKLPQFLFTGEFWIAYILLIFLLLYRKLSVKLFSYFTLSFVLLELGINTYSQLDHLREEWNFPSRQAYQENLTDIDKLVKQTKTVPQFVRTERLLPQTGNDSMKYGYNGISQFSSIRNTASSHLLDKLGFKSEGTNLNLRYQNNTLIADSLFGVTYNLSNSPISKYGFTLSDQSGNMRLYKNEYALPLGIVTQGIYQDISLSHLTLDNQTHLLHQLTGRSENYFTKLSSQRLNGVKETSKRIQATAPAGSDTASLSYQITVPADSQVYVNLPHLSQSNADNRSIRVQINDRWMDYTLDNAFPLLDLGASEHAQVLKIHIEFPTSASVFLDPPQFYRLDLQAFRKAVTQLKQASGTTSVKGHQVYSTFQTDRPTSIVYTLPFDKGWSASLNGKPVPIQPVQGGLMKVDVPAGSAKVVLTFIPQGFLTGSILSLSGMVLFFLYQWWISSRRNYRQKKLTSK